MLKKKMLRSKHNNVVCNWSAIKAAMVNDYEEIELAAEKPPQKAKAKRTRKKTVAVAPAPKVEVAPSPTYSVEDILDDIKEG